MATVGKPVIACGWGGHTDFLYQTKNQVRKSKSGKKRKKLIQTPQFSEVFFEIGPVGGESIWPGVIEEGTMWCHPKEESYKKALRGMVKDYDKKWLPKAAELSKWVKTEFEPDKQLKMMADAIDDGSEAKAEEWLTSINLDEID